jgi:hypothetical protein
VDQKVSHKEKVIQRQPLLSEKLSKRVVEVLNQVLLVGTDVAIVARGLLPLRSKNLNVKQACFPVDQI